MELIFGIEEINKAADWLLNNSTESKIFAFYGEMGAGKTTFINAVCKQLGTTEPGSSPTFSIINEYITKAGAIIYHMDWYRLKDEEEAIHAGVENCIYSNNLCFIEWPEKAEGLLPEHYLKIGLEVLPQNQRKITVTLL